MKIYNSYVKAFESYRLTGIQTDIHTQRDIHTDRQTDAIEVIRHTASQLVMKQVFKTAFKDGEDMGMTVVKGYAVANVRCDVIERQLIALSNSVYRTATSAAEDSTD